MNIVQIGCNDGNDHVFKFVNSFKDKLDALYLIDVSKLAIEKAKIQYKNIPNVTFFNIGITDDENQEELEIFYAENELDSEHLSYRKNHHKDHSNNKPIYSFFIKCMTINNFLKNNNIKNLDELYVDTEGLDCRIINSLDLELYKIKKIQFEHKHSEKTFDRGNSEVYLKVVENLKLNNYTVNKVNGDTIATKLDLHKNFT